MSKKEEKESLFCSFCGKSQKESKKAKTKANAKTKAKQSGKK